MNESARTDLVELCLRLGDDRLVLGHRLSEWIGHAPVLEEELALGNLALDLLGQASDLLDRAGELEGKGRTADGLAFFRDVTGFRNALLVEQPNGDFATTIVRQLFFDAWDLHLAAALEASSDRWLVRFAERSGKEAAYHWRHSREWTLRLGDGTEESHRRTSAAVEALWGFVPELFEKDDVVARLVEAKVLADPEALRGAWTEAVAGVLREAGLAVPSESAFPASGGRRGLHGEALGRMLSEMQSLARAFPGASW
jgi:ring-1,2-phenylacetyl-CoA epoxidase subunit PaaC